MDVTGTPAEGVSSGGPRTYRMPAARLALTPGVSHGPLAGAWWPRCDMLELELPALLGSLGPGLGTVARVTVDAVAWPDAPRRVTLPGRVIEVALSAVDAEAHAIALDRDTAGCRELLVIPPGRSLTAATWLLTTAADPWNTLTAAHMLALAETGFEGDGR
ncbi:DUF5994 family protein [Streptomyces alanosinicus]|uniref:Uncharacterized protein n=1 Tax=Streptomyces alanosinicus TaxID=68171 RepID=A0A918YPG5_9ACTN|nr:DUF5994 family protein [Streptomyces alanosinicus]GHE10674.1 hypothetical protein GCM10010339_67690 [Streptomyces alanosinicus]